MNAIQFVGKIMCNQKKRREKKRPPHTPNIKFIQPTMSKRWSESHTKKGNNQKSNSIAEDETTTTTNNSLDLLVYMET